MKTRRERTGQCTASLLSSSRHLGQKCRWLMNPKVLNTPLIFQYDRITEAKLNSGLKLLYILKFKPGCAFLNWFFFFWISRYNPICVELINFMNTCRFFFYCILQLVKCVSSLNFIRWFSESCLNNFSASCDLSNTNLPPAN